MHTALNYTQRYSNIYYQNKPADNIGRNYVKLLGATIDNQLEF